MSRSLVQLSFDLRKTRRVNCRNVGVEVTIRLYLHNTRHGVSAVTVTGGINLATGDAVEVGEAAGANRAQSTLVAAQLTMRTFRRLPNTGYHSGLPRQEILCPILKGK